MTALLVTGVVALAVLVVFQGLVLLEMVRQLSQIRRELDFDDRPVPISVGKLAGEPLPEPVRAAWSENGGLPTASSSSSARTAQRAGWSRRLPDLLLIRATRGRRGSPGTP